MNVIIDRRLKRLLNPEMLWLLRATASAQGWLDDDRPSARSKPDWARVYPLAAMHEVASLAYLGWKTSALRDSLPAAIEQKFRADYLFHFASNRRLLAEVAGIHHRLTASGVEAVFHGALWLTFCAYPDPATRPLTDIRLSLEAKQFETALKALRRSGYRLELGLPTRWQSAAALAPGSLRLHSRVGRPVRMYLSGPDWPRVRDGSRTLSGIHPAARVSDAHATLLMCLAEAGDGFLKLRLLHDLLHIVTAGGDLIDWNEIRARGRHELASRATPQTLSFIRHFFAHLLPAAVVAPLPAGQRDIRQACAVLGIDALRTRPRVQSKRPALDVLATHYGSDKAILGYTRHYERLLGRHRSRPLNLLEIGVGGHAAAAAGGASLRMWKRFLPRARIAGIDKYAKAIREPRIRCFQGDQADPAFLAYVASQTGPIHIIIDDGSHVSRDVITAFKTLFPYLMAGGLYVVEDIQTAYAEPRRGVTSIAFFKRLVDAVNAELVPDPPSSYLHSTVTGVEFHRNLVVIHKGLKP